MDTEKNKNPAVTSGEGESVSGYPVSRRPWRKPMVNRIDIKRTMASGGSGGDSALQSPP